MIAKVLSGRWIIAIALVLTACALALIVTARDGVPPEWFVALASTAVYAYFNRLPPPGGSPA